MTKFTQAAFIYNTDPEDRKEIIDFCETIGYRKSKALKAEYGSYIFVDKDKISISNNLGYLKRVLQAINCGTDTAMFRALAALRDDSDYMQWFVMLQNYGNNKIGEWVFCANKNTQLFPKIYHKATPAEIVEHFKDKK